MNNNNNKNNNNNNKSINTCTKTTLGMRLDMRAKKKGLSVEESNLLMRRWNRRRLPSALATNTWSSWYLERIQIKIISAPCST